jgi:integrase
VFLNAWLQLLLYREEKEMSVSKRCDKWHYAFCIRGIRYRKAIQEAQTKYEAKQAEAEAMKAVYEGRYGRATGEQDFLEFVRKVFLLWSKTNKRSWYDDELWAQHVAVWFKGKTFAQISPLLVEKFKRERRESLTKKGERLKRAGKETNERRSPATVNREMEILSKVFTLAVEYGVTTDNPCRKVKKLHVNNKRMRYLLDEEEPRLFAQLVDERAHLRDMVTVAIGTGMRRSDHFPLRRGKMDFQRDYIWVPNSKTGRDYPVPMSDAVRNVMRRHCEGKDPNDYVFINRETGKPYTDLKKAFKKACELACIKGLRWNDLRHTFGTRLGIAGANAFEIKELMGHTDIRTSLRYVHPVTERKRTAVESVIKSREKEQPERVCHNPATGEERPAARLALTA